MPGGALAKGMRAGTSLNHLFHERPVQWWGNAILRAPQ